MPVKFPVDTKELRKGKMVQNAASNQLNLEIKESFQRSFHSLSTMKGIILFKFNSFIVLK